MLTRGFVLVVVVIGVLLSVGGSWGVATLVSSNTATLPSSSATGAPGKAGSDGKNGVNGKDGVDGADGANGAPGSNGRDAATSATPARGLPGAQGTMGAQGLTGPQGPAGPSGASAPTFSALSPSGLTVNSVVGNGYTFVTQTTVVPTGPALVGFSVGLQDPFLTLASVSCSLIDANDPTTVFATTAEGTVAFPGSFSTFAATQVVNLTTPTSLAVQCNSDPAGIAPLYAYENLSIYAISFAP